MDADGLGTVTIESLVAIESPGVPSPTYRIDIAAPCELQFQRGVTLRSVELVEFDAGH